MRQVLLADGFAKTPERFVVKCTRDGDLLGLTGAPLGHAEEEAEAGWIAFGQRRDCRDGLRRRLGIALLAEEQRETQKYVGSDGVARWRCVVEKVLRTGDQCFAVDRCIEEAAVRVIGEAFDYLIN